jgi:hypothetical protein
MRGHSLEAAEDIPEETAALPLTLSATAGHCNKLLRPRG